MFQITIEWYWTLTAMWIDISGGTLCCDNRHTINRNRSAVPEKSRLIRANWQPRYLCLSYCFGSILNHILGQNDCFLFGCSSIMAQQCHLTWTSFLLSSTSIQNIYLSFLVHWRKLHIFKFTASPNKSAITRSCFLLIVIARQLIF